MTTFERPGWREYYLAGAKWVSTRADCRRRQVGAILVADNNEVLGIGYNGTDAGAAGCLSGACPRGLLSYDEQPAFGSYSNCIARHAEHNALLNIPSIDVVNNPHERWWLFDQYPTMFITDEPCDNCLRLMTECGVFKAIWPKGEIAL